MRTANEVALALPRWLEYVGLIDVIGVFVVTRLGANSPRIAWARPSMELGLAAALIGGVCLVAAEAFAEGRSPSGAATFLFADPAGWVRIARVAAEAGALALCLTRNRWVAPLTLWAAASLAFAGHAAQSQSPAGAVFADALHVLSAGAWAGGIITLATLRPPGGWSAEEGRSLLWRFGRVALIAFVVTAMTGVVEAASVLGGLSDLWTTPYGLVLAAKSAGVLVMVVLSTLAWRRGLGLVRFEATVAVLVLAATAVLATTPLPASTSDGITLFGVANPRP